MWAWEKSQSDHETKLTEIIKPGTSLYFVDKEAIHLRKVDRAKKVSAH